MAHTVLAHARREILAEACESLRPAFVASRRFPDRANFSCGKLDGHYCDFTWKALALYRQSRGEQPATPPPQTKAKRGAAAPTIPIRLATPRAMAAFASLIGMSSVSRQK